MVWISPDRMEHFLSAKEIRDFLADEMQRDPARRTVDILSIKSAPSGDRVCTVAFEVNLVPKDGQETVNLRCSMAICKRGQHYEITMLHMSEKFHAGAIDKIREFTENLPCGIMIFAYMKGEGLRMVFCNDYFREKLRFKEETFRKLSDRDPFFMVSEEEKAKLMEKLDEISGTREHFAQNVTFLRRDGKRFQHRVIGAPAYQEGGNTVYYCVFQETTGFHLVHAQVRQKADLSTAILRAIPGGICVFAGEERRPVYAGRNLPELFGREADTLLERVKTDPFYGLEMTSITKNKLRDSLLEMQSADPYAGTFQLVRGDGESRWTDFYLIHSRMKGGEPLLIQLYIDRDEQKREMIRQINQAESMSRAQQERSKEEARLAQETLAQEIEAARSTAQREAEEEKKKALEAIQKERDALVAAAQRERDVRIASVEKDRDARIAAIVKDKDARIASLEQERDARIAMLEKERDARVAALEQERDARIEALEAERDMRITALMQESERLREELMRLRSDRIETAPVYMPGEMPQTAVSYAPEPEDSLEETAESRKAAEETKAEEEHAADASAAETVDGLQETAFSPAALLEEVYGVMKPVCAKRGVQLTLQKSVSLPQQVEGDYEKLKQAICSIMESVAGETPADDVIALAGRADRAAGNRVIMYFTVRDSRSGIAEALRAGLFEKKGEGEDPVRESLYSARELLREMGGTVQVRGRHGEGTVFILTVNLKM